MNNQNAQNGSSDKRWDLSLLRYELQQLKKEREHLHSKSRERSLSDWESKRISSLSSEIGQLIKAVSKRADLNQHTAL